ncbi:MAG: hypothetical protein KatS3mg068_2468 [Candidatus Sericytochromatia bacterium]|nr:MAG: hypothetical protein KatS3mg068_2468 [Candidatus Sericytochromatia bacterium]
MTDDTIENIINDLKPFLNQAQKKVIKDILDKFNYFLSFVDLSRFILLTLEKHFNLDNDTLQKLEKHFSDISKNTINSTIESLPINIPKDLIMDNQRAIDYSKSTTSLYFSKFFNKDQNVHTELIKFLNRYYFEEGNPIGKNKAGIKKFIKKFGNFLTTTEDYKVRQIIDTTVSYIKSSSTIKQMYNAKIQFYRWDGTNDRLTCKICRSMDGRIFKTENAVKLLEKIENSDPSKLPEIKPFILKPQKGKSDTIKSIFAPAHPNCRCRMQAHFDDNSINTTVSRPDKVEVNDLQKELEEEFNNLSNQERINRIKSHLSATWVAKTQGGQFDFDKEHLKDHYKKHKKKFNFLTLDEYVKQSYEVIKNPENVYVQKHKKYISDKKTIKTTKYIFEKDRKIVVVNDDNLVIASYHKLYE